MKVCILTLNGNYNYGNKLQNYALEQTLIKLGCEVETLWIDVEQENKRMYIKLLQGLKREISNRINPNQKKINSLNNLKEQGFKVFSRNYLNEVDRNRTDKAEIEKLLERYDFFVVGSDQVWNPYFVGNELSTYLLDFVPKTKSISYAASFGVNNLPSAKKEIYKSRLVDFKALSVREKRGVDLISDLAGIDAKLVLDPTMLLSNFEWRELTKFYDSKVKGDYILTYYLGTLEESIQEYIEGISNAYSLPIVNIGNEKEEDIYISNPAEFLKLIDECTLFFTDSFHGCVFSILFEKPFVVFKRQGKIEMYSRIETLLEEFKLENRAYEMIDNNDSIFIANYSNTNVILNQKKEHSLNFLKSSIG